jgi:hypothetical protein
MTYRLLADALVAIHLAFIAFVVAGGLLALHRRAWMLLHLPALAWGAWAEFTATICPLTPWENSLRRAAGEAGYAGGSSITTSCRSSTRRPDAVRRSCWARGVRARSLRRRWWRWRRK